MLQAKLQLLTNHCAAGSLVSQARGTGFTSLQITLRPGLSAILSELIALRPLFRETQEQFPVCPHMDSIVTFPTQPAGRPCAFEPAPRVHDVVSCTTGPRDIKELNKPGRQGARTKTRCNKEPLFHDAQTPARE